MEGEENSKISENPSSDEPLTHLKAYVGHFKQIVFKPLIDKKACTYLKSGPKTMHAPCSTGFW